MTKIRCTHVLMLFLIVFLSHATAHGPTRQKVTESIDIDLPPEKVWSVIGNFSDGTWIAGVTASEGDGNAAGAMRTLTLGNKQVHETLKSYNADKMTFKYRIPDKTHDVNILPVTNYSATLTVKPKADGSTVIWKGAFYRGYPNNDPPLELNDEAAVAAVTMLYQNSLKQLKNILEGN